MVAECMRWIAKVSGYERTRGMINDDDTGYDKLIRNHDLRIAEMIWPESSIVV